MATIFSRIRPGAASSGPSSSSSPSKKDPNPPQLTPLEKHLRDAGPSKEDGSDKFWGLENFGNTCYANSILQCLYYSAPFRQQVINYPSPTPSHSVLHGPTGQQRLQVNTTSLPLNHPSLTYNKLMNRPTAQNASARTSAGPPTTAKPEDKEHPDYKKRVAQTRGPNMAMNYDNAAAYGMNESLFTSLKDIFEALAIHQSKVGVVSPTRLLEILRRDNEMYRTAMHQDAHEFLNLLLNDIMENVKAHSKKLAENQHSNGSTDKSEFEKELQRAMPQLKGRDRWIHDLFEGTLTSETKCLTCENASQRDEVFLDLSVDLEEHTSVTSCLRKFSEEEMLCERNKFHCDICGGLQEAEKRMKIKRLPKILALHLKRFKFTDDFQRLQKLFHRVVYPYHLRLFNTTDDVDDPDRLYELYAVVVHIGGGPYHGHYVSIIKTEDRGWLLFDDEMVEPVDKSYVQNFFGDRPGLACAYVLFYQETTMEAVRREQETDIRPPMVKAVVPAKENVSLGSKANGFLGGLYHVKSAAGPGNLDEARENLDRVVSEPPSANATLLGHSPATADELTALPPLPVSANTADESKSKKDRQKEEKERKAAARFQAKEEEKERRRTLELMRRDKTRKPEVDPKIAVSRPEDENKTGYDNTADTTNGSTGGLSRFRNTSKSFRKPKFLSSREASKDEPAVNGTETSAATVPIQRPDSLPKAAEKSSDKARNRFSTALRKKTSNMMM